MANTLVPLLKPVSDLWNHYTGDAVLKDLTTYKKEWHTKFLQSERLHLNEEYNAAQKRMYGEPELLTLLGDNIARFTAFAFVERLVAVRQAHGVLRARHEFANSISGGLNAVRAQGIFFGAFRGNLLNALHFSLVYYHPLILAKGNAISFIAYTTLFETLAYPLDTIKTLVYADVNRTYRSVWDLLKQNFEKRGIEMLYRGLPLKLAYNALFGLNLVNISNDSNLVYLTTPLWLASYALLTVKTRLQVAESTLSSHRGEDASTVLQNTLRRGGIKGLYAGIIPFAALNLSLAWALPSLYSDEKRANIIDEIVSRAPGKRERNWASA